MATAVSTSLTADAAHSYVYPEAVTYDVDSGSDEFLYALELRPSPLCVSRSRESPHLSVRTLKRDPSDATTRNTDTRRVGDSTPSIR